MLAADRRDRPGPRRALRHLRRRIHNPTRAGAQSGTRCAAADGKVLVDGSSTAWRAVGRRASRSRRVPSTSGASWIAGLAGLFGSPLRQRARQWGRPTLEITASGGGFQGEGSSLLPARPRQDAPADGGLTGSGCGREAIAAHVRRHADRPAVESGRSARPHAVHHPHRNPGNEARASCWRAVRTDVRESPPRSNPMLKHVRGYLGAKTVSFALPSGRGAHGPNEFSHGQATSAARWRTVACSTAWPGAA